MKHFPFKAICEDEKPHIQVKYKSETKELVSQLLLQSLCMCVY